jgi:LPS-assembly protein
VLLGADSVTFDDEHGIVTATGHVELSQGNRTVRADAITYNRNSKVVTAAGNIRLVESSGEVLFSDYAELTDDLKDAFIDNIRVLMTDDGRMAGTEGERRGGRLTRINNGIYSPCELCADDRTKPPVWQIRAVRIVHDNVEKEVRYRDAVMELFGVPVAYTPYLSHPDPTVNSRTGFLAPHFGHASGLGYFIRSRYFFDITPDQDATVEVGGYSKQGLMLGGQYRKRLENGRFEVGGSVTNGSVPNSSEPDAPTERHVRGHLFGAGLFEIDDVWRAGFNLRRASDRTYLRKYFDFRDDFLTSRAFVEGFQGRNYATVTALSFQDLRVANTIQPVVAPLAEYSALGEPGGFLGGRWSFTSGLQSIYRSDGPETRRFSIEPGWRRTLFSDTGLVTTVSARTLLAGYDWVHYTPPNATPGVGPGGGSAVRTFPQADVNFRYPLARNGESSQQLIEPIVAVTAAPRVSNSDRYPNEDSRDVEFDVTNLFRANRFPGIDRLEGGTRVTYGLRGAVYGHNTGMASVFLGQSYRFNRDDSYPSLSGLETGRSDYVGQIDLVPDTWLGLNYGFRIDQETLKPRRHSVNGTVGPPVFNVGVGYTYVNQNSPPPSTLPGELEQLGITVGSQINRYWSARVGHLQSMRPDPGPRGALAVLTYQDECLTFDTVMRKDFTEVPDIGSGFTVFFRFVFKNLGEVKTPSISGSIFSPSQSTNSLPQ